MSVSKCKKEAWNGSFNLSSRSGLVPISTNNLHIYLFNWPAQQLELQEAPHLSCYNLQLMLSHFYTVHTWTLHLQLKEGEAI